MSDSIDRGSSPIVIVDCAGAVMGGALRFLQELDAYLCRSPSGIATIGRQHRMNGVWLVERELRARLCDHSVALNNVTFARGGHFNTVLLRNALHFLTEEEQSFVRVGRSLRLQTRIVRGLLRRADRIVVPSSSMAERVATSQPFAADRITVMHHPLSRSRASPVPGNVVLCPVLDAPYKQLGKRLADVVIAMESLRADRAGPSPALLLTLTPREARALRLQLPDWVHLLGRLTPTELQSAQRSAKVIVYPTTLESFGYPLAEARLDRRPVIAPLTQHAQEVAGDALVPYDPSNPRSLVEAVRTALELRLDPMLVNPFDPGAYFRTLFRVA